MKRQTALASFLKLSAWACLLAAGGAVSPALAAPPDADSPPTQGLSVGYGVELIHGPPVSAADASLKTSAATPLLDITQDTSGNLWGIVPSPAVWNSAWSVARWSGGHWNLQETPPDVKGGAIKLAAAPDGAIIGVWNTGAVFEFRFGALRQLAKIPCKPDRDTFTGLYADTSDVWVMSKAGDIFCVDRRVESKTPFLQVYKSNPANFFPGYSPDAVYFKDPIYAPLTVLKDTLGRLWFWAQGVDSGTGWATLRGFLLWDGAKMQHLPQIKGLPIGLADKQNKNSNPRYDCVVEHDADHLWIAVRQAGIFSLDIHTLIAAPVPEPEKDAFKFTQRIAPVGADWAVITGNGGYAATTPDNPGGLANDLWLLHDGAWKKTLTGLDKTTFSATISTRPLLAAPEGLWVGTFGGGLRFIPSDGTAPHKVDWRLGYRLSNTDRLFSMPSRAEGIVAVALMQPPEPSGLVANIEGYASLSAPKTGITLQTPLEMVQDSKGNLWNVTIKQGAAKTVGTLDKWDGAAWTSIPLPPEANAHCLEQLAINPQNRLWLAMSDVAPNQPEYRVFIYDTADKTWVKYQTYEKALEAQAALTLRDKSGRPSPSAFHWSASFGATPCFSGGKICYSENESTVHYFDGSAWRVYERPEILPGAPGEYCDGAPFFDKNGTLSANINVMAGVIDRDKFRTYRLLDGQTWSAGVFEEGVDDIGRVTPRPTLPPGLIATDYTSCVQDQSGTLWLIGQGMLYRMEKGKRVAQFASDAPNPFRDGRNMYKVLIDPRGGAFIYTYTSEQKEYVFVPARTQDGAAFARE